MCRYRSLAAGLARFLGPLYTYYHINFGIAIFLILVAIVTHLWLYIPALVPILLALRTISRNLVRCKERRLISVSPSHVDAGGEDELFAGYQWAAPFRVSISVACASLPLLFTCPELRYLLLALWNNTTVYSTWQTLAAAIMACFASILGSILIALFDARTRVCYYFAL